MGLYLDRDFMFAEHTLFSYSGIEKDLVLPETLAGESIECIGKGAFHANKTLVSLVIPKTVKRIEDSAFDNCTNLSTIIFEGIPEYLGIQRLSFCSGMSQMIFQNLTLSHAVYAEMHRNSTSFGGVQRIASRFPDLPFAFGKNPLHGTTFTDVAHAAFVPPESPALYRISDYNPAPRVQCLYESSSLEFEGILRLIQDRPPEYSTLLCEKGNDHADRMGDSLTTNHKIDPSTVVIFTFDPTTAKGTPSGITFQATLMYGRFYWQSIRRVVMQGKEYFVYRRHFLTENFSIYHGYQREDIAVFTAQGLVQDEEEVKRVYAKYRLLSSL